MTSVGTIPALAVAESAATIPFSDKETVATSAANEEDFNRSESSSWLDKSHAYASRSQTLWQIG